MAGSRYGAGNIKDEPRTFFYNRIEAAEDCQNCAKKTQGPV